MKNIILYICCFLLFHSASATLPPAPVSLFLESDNPDPFPGETISISVKANGFTGVAGVQFSFEWDPLVLQLNGFGNYNLPELSANNFGTVNASNGQLGFAWIDYYFSGADLAPGSVLFSISFTVVGSPGQSTDISFSEIPTKRKAYDGQLNPILLDFQGAQITVAVTEPPVLAIYASQETGSLGETLCVDVMADNFLDVFSMQFSMQYDPAVMTFLGIQDYGLPWMDEANFGAPVPGAVAVSWYNQDLYGITLPDGAVLFSVCFTPVACGLSSNFDFTDTPVFAEFASFNGGNGAIMPFTFASGSATVSNIWFKDADNDGWSDGSTLTQCPQPTGYKLAADLLGTSGDCADGLGQVPGYPNNPRANIYPGAPELCNGIDDNCDGTIDEGLSGFTYVGNLTFTNQFELNNFPSCYTAISGKLTLQGFGITDLSPLANLTSVGGELKLFNTAVSDLSPLQNLTQIGRLTIQNNGFLTTLNGLSPALTIGGNLRIMQNMNLSDCCAIEHFLLYGGVSGNIQIQQNATGCKNQNEVLSSCPLFAPPPSPQQAGYEENWSSEESAISIFPNPTTGELQISFSGESAYIQLFNSLGQLMLERRAAGGAERLDLSRLSDGVYWVRVYVEGAEEEEMIGKVVLKK